MKKFPLFFAIIIMIVACNSTTKNSEEKDATQEVAYLSVGDSITADNAISKEEMAKLYESIEITDTIEAKFVSTVNAVCQRKGCWMRLDLGEGREAQIKFKDYGFFVPMNLSGEEVVVEGKAYISVLTEHEKKYYATDEGKSQEEIDQITVDTKTMLFEAHGVLIKEE